MLAPSHPLSPMFGILSSVSLAHISCTKQSWAGGPPKKFNTNPRVSPRWRAYKSTSTSQRKPAMPSSTWTPLSITTNTRPRLSTPRLFPTRSDSCTWEDSLLTTATSLNGMKRSSRIRCPSPTRCYLCRICSTILIAQISIVPLPKVSSSRLWICTAHRITAKPLRKISLSPHLRR